jgi:hypothetical protein
MAERQDVRMGCDLAVRPALHLIESCNIKHAIFVTTLITIPQGVSVGPAVLCHKGVDCVVLLAEDWISEMLV